MNRIQDNRVVWKLVVAADVPGVDYHAEFEVPVFETEESAKDFKITEDPSVERVVPELGKKLEQAGIRVELLPAGKRLVFPMARSLGPAIGLTVFFGVWTAIVVGLHFSDAPRIFPWVFGFFDALIFLGVVDLWLHHGLHRSPTRRAELCQRPSLYGSTAKAPQRGSGKARREAGDAIGEQALLPARRP